MGEGTLFSKWLEETVGNKVSEMLARSGVEGILFAYETWLRSYDLIDIKAEENYNDTRRAETV
jgi:hypothetical protein